MVQLHTGIILTVLKLDLIWPVYHGTSCKNLVVLPGCALLYSVLLSLYVLSYYNTIAHKSIKTKRNNFNDGDGDDGSVNNSNTIGFEPTNQY